MKILYGVQGTGNGHITRARAMANALKQYDIDVQFLVSGRTKPKLFDMEPFGNYWWREGLTFQSKKGRVVLTETVVKSRPFQLAHDVRELDVSQFDLIVTDYEPITAWAGRLAKIPVLGLGHQYAFSQDIPQADRTLIDKVVLQNFAPVDIELGLHWHHFDAPILPPIAPIHDTLFSSTEDFVLVYLPFESSSDIARLLRSFENQQFVIYHPEAPSRTAENLVWRAPSRTQFPRDLGACSGVICNAGFELSSEALQLGKKLLVKPLNKQVEQHSNAIALEQLGWGQSMARLDRSVVSQWLSQKFAPQLVYPDVAGAVAAYIAKGANSNRNDLIQGLWAESRLPEYIENAASIAA